MPIEYGDIEWPPRACAEPNRLHREYEAWYSGDVAAIGGVYGGGASPLPTAHASQYRGGVTGAIARFWWGRPITPNQATTRFHVPAPSDVSSYSSDLLYRDPLVYTLPDVASDAARERMTKIVDDGSLHARLLELGETTSYGGGAYIVAYVDQVIADVPLTTVYAQDSAVPEWRNGYLWAVTFWRRLDGGDRPGDVWRHLERHEVLRGTSPVGMVYHALYLGTDHKLGTRMALEARPETAGLAARVGEDGGMATGSSRLDAVYVPNVKPNRAMRGSPLGRSDYHDTTSSFDALDETWSSWMRDIRLAKGRLVVPRSYLQSAGSGQGATFDTEQEVFSSVNTLGGLDRGMAVSQVQFAIRVAEHEQTCAAHWRTILRHVGLSQDAFGEEVDGGVATAKEIGRRGERTRATRDRKILYARPEISKLATVLQELDVFHFRPTGGVSAMPVRADWPSETPDLETMSRTLQMLDAASAVSTRVKVAMLHPRWSEPEVDEEVARIDAQGAMPALSDPGTFTGA
jgi:hypothetical protein